jgi:hypothetical protein
MWNRNRAAVSGRLSWCATSRCRPGPAGGRRENTNATRAVPRAAVERELSRRDMPLGRRPGRMLYETAARASKVLALDVQDPRPRWPPGPDPLQGRRHRMDPLGFRHRTVNKRPRRFTNASGSLTVVTNAAARRFLI